MSVFKFKNFEVSSSNKIDELILLLKIAKHGYAICTYSDPKTYNYWLDYLKTQSKNTQIFIKEKKYQGHEEDLIQYLENETSSFYEKVKDSLQKFSSDYENLAFSISGLEIKYEINDIGRLNILRDFFLTFKHFVVLWIPDNYLKEIALKTPDLWRIRTKVFQFDKSDRNIALGMKSLEDDSSLSLEYFTKATENNMKNSQSWNNKGICLMKLNRFEESLVCFDQAMKLAPYSVQFLNNYGVNLCLLKQHKQSIPYFKKGIEIDGKDPRILINYGRALIKLHSFRDATSCFNRILKIDSENHIAKICLSDIYLKTGKWKKALECLKPLITTHPLEINTLINIGIAETKLKNYDSAIAYFDKVLSLDPQNIEAVVNRGILYSKMNKRDDALACFNRVLEMDETHIEANQERKKIVKKHIV